MDQGLVLMSEACRCRRDVRELKRTSCAQQAQALISGGELAREALDNTYKPSGAFGARGLNTESCQRVTVEESTKSRARNSVDSTVQATATRITRQNQVTKSDE